MEGAIEEEVRLTLHNEEEYKNINKVTYTLE